MFGTIKRRTTDILFSKYLRKKREYTCEKCGTRHAPNSRNFGVSHFWGRSAESVRFDERNCDVLCNIPCHSYFEQHKTEYEYWKHARMGDPDFNRLKLDAHLTGYRDDKRMMLVLKELMREV